MDSKWYMFRKLSKQGNFLTIKNFKKCTKMKSNHGIPLDQLGRQSYNHEGFNTINIKYWSYRIYIRITTRWGDSKRREVSSVLHEKELIFLFYIGKSIDNTKRENQKAGDIYRGN